MAEKSKMATGNEALAPGAVPADDWEMAEEAGAASTPPEAASAAHSDTGIGPEDPSLIHLAEHVAAAPSGAVAESFEPAFIEPASGEPEGFSLADDPELIGDFIQEATEHLGSIEALTLVIEQTPDDRESLNALFRSFHSIKGLAGFLELHAIRALSHEVETLLDLARNGEATIESMAIDCILASADFIRRGVDALSLRLNGNRVPLPALDQQLCEAVAGLLTRQQGAAPVASPNQMDVPRQQEVQHQGDVPAGADVPEPAVLSEKNEAPEQVGVPDTFATSEPASDWLEAGRADEAVGPRPAPSLGAARDALAFPAAAASDLLASGENSAGVVRTAGVHAPPPTTGAKAGGAGPAMGASGSVKVETAKLDYLVNMVGEFVIAQSIVRHDPDLHLADHPRLQRNFAQMTRITAEIQRSAMSMRMVPIQGLFQRMARLVRDLARKTAKDVEFVQVGEETELDRTLIEQLADPLMHMVRNSLDHGIETVAERERTGKNPKGRVQLRAAHESGGIVIEISDDGRGLNREKILSRAIERGLLPANANPPDSEVWGLIFEPGFSTAEKVTDISGRGVGMDVVRRNIQQLRGRIEVSSTAGKGASVVLRLPLTLAIIDALLVGVGDHRFILPMYAVKEMFRPARGAVTRVRANHEEGVDEVVDVRGSLLPVHRPGRFLGVPSKALRPEDALLVVLENQAGTFCLLVDDFLGKQEVVIKPLGATFRHVSGISSGAILGDGKVALILDVDGLLQRRSGGRKAVAGILAGGSAALEAGLAEPCPEPAHV